MSQKIVPGTKYVFMNWDSRTVLTPHHLGTMDAVVGFASDQPDPIQQWQVSEVSTNNPDQFWLWNVGLRKSMNLSGQADGSAVNCVDNNGVTNATKWKFHLWQDDISTTYSWASVSCAQRMLPES